MVHGGFGSFLVFAKRYSILYAVDVLPYTRDTGRVVLANRWRQLLRKQPRLFRPYIMAGALLFAQYSTQHTEFTQPIMVVLHVVVVVPYIMSRTKRR